MPPAPLPVPFPTIGAKSGRTASAGPLHSLPPAMKRGGGARALLLVEALPAAADPDASAYTLECRLVERRMSCATLWTRAPASPDAIVDRDNASGAGNWYRKLPSFLAASFALIAWISREIVGVW